LWAAERRVMKIEANLGQPPLLVNGHPLRPGFATTTPVPAPVPRTPTPSAPASPATETCLATSGQARHGSHQSALMAQQSATCQQATAKFRRGMLVRESGGIKSPRLRSRSTAGMRPRSHK
jgi:hypothetical protein